MPHTKDQLHIVAPPMAEALQFDTLMGFVDYIENRTGDALPPALLVHVSSPYTVSLLGPLSEKFRTRERFARALRGADCGFKFGAQYEVEDFTIALMTLFEKSDGRDAVIAIAGKMSAENVLTSDDDGFTQAVGQRAGVTLQKRATLANPFSLAPHRTFAEVAQPESPFIFRVHQAGEGKLPKCALYECDNGAWKLEAVKRVAAWINGEFDGRGIDIPVLA